MLIVCYVDLFRVKCLRVWVYEIYLRVWGGFWMIGCVKFLKVGLIC